MKTAVKPLAPGGRVRLPKAGKSCKKVLCKRHEGGNSGRIRLVLRIRHADAVIGFPRRAWEGIAAPALSAVAKSGCAGNSTIRLQPTFSLPTNLMCLEETA
jgi:hypothetical protein